MTRATLRRRPRSGRAFTLLEVVVVVIIVAVLVAIATVGYVEYANGARDTKVQEQLHQLSTQALAYAAQNDIEEDLTRDMYAAGLQSFPDVVTPGTSAAGLGWSIVPGEQPPADEHQFSVSFDNGIGTSINDTEGTRVAVVTRSDTGKYFAQIELAKPAGTDTPPAGAFEVPAGATAQDVLGGAVSPAADLPYPATSPSTSSPTPTSTVDAGGTSTPAPSSTPTANPTQTADPVNSPVTVTPRPQTDWTSCAGNVAGSPDATVTRAQITTHGDTTAWWSESGDTSGIAGFKVCAVDDNTGQVSLLASTGPGTGDARSWVVRTNTAHPNISVRVVTVMSDGNEYAATNQCEVRPAGNANGWGSTC